MEPTLIVTIMNASIGLAAAIYAVRNRDARLYMASLFLYITFHYTYSVLGIFDYDRFSGWRATTQPGAKAVGFLFILFIIVEIYRRYVIKNYRFLRSSTTTLPIILAILWVSLTISQWGLTLLSGHPPTRIAIQDTFSVGLMLVLLLGFSIALEAEDADNAAFWKIVHRMFPITLIAMLLVAIYQIAFSRVFAIGIFPSGEWALRACSFLFNPNVLGFWAALSILFLSFAYHSDAVRAIYAIPLIWVAGLCIFLSGSRSCLMITAFFLISSTIFLIFARRKYRLGETLLPATSLLVASLFTLSVIKVMEIMTSGSIEVIHSLSLLVDRILSIPYLIMYYVGSLVEPLSPQLSTFLMGTVYMPKSLIMAENYTDKLGQNPDAYNVLLNLEQRLTTSAGLADNGFIAVYEAGGWLGFLPWFLLWITLIWFGLRAFYLKRDVKSSYAVTAVLGCAFAASSMRLFQVFPFWILVALCLGPSIYWIQSVLDQNRVKKTSKMTNPISSL